MSHEDWTALNLEQVGETLGHHFAQPDYLREALTHASVAGDRLLSNERMEFLGDAVLGFVVCDYLYRTYPDLHEGEMTKIKSAVVSRRVCAQVSQKLDLSAMLMVGKGMSNRPSLPSSIVAAVLESVIAAVYLDGGLDAARAFVLRHFKGSLDDAAVSTHLSNFKSVLQQYAQKHLPGTPEYLLLDEKGPDHAKCFEVCAALHGRRFSPAWAASKKEAEQKAALNALRDLSLAWTDEHGRVHIREDDGETIMPMSQGLDEDDND